MAIDLGDRPAYLDLKLRHDADLRLLRDLHRRKLGPDPDGRLAAGRQAEIVALKASVDAASRNLLDHPGRPPASRLLTHRKPPLILPLGTVGTLTQQQPRIPT